MILVFGIMSVLCNTNVAFSQHPVHELNTWERPELGLLSENDLGMILEEIEGRDRLHFARLTHDQQRFAVNPSYKSYKAPTLAGYEPHPEIAAANQESSESGNNDEVADDPFSEETKDKKASYERGEVTAIKDMLEQEKRIQDIYFTTIVACSSGLAAIMIVGIGIAFHSYMKKYKAAEDVEYPAYGVTGPGDESSPTATDRKLAQNAQLYHYQHQKQQMIAFDSNNTDTNHSNGTASDNDSEDEGDDNDYTVYECPGLAPTTGEMEVRNPLFDEQVADDTCLKAKK